MFTLFPFLVTLTIFLSFSSAHERNKAWVSKPLWKQSHCTKECCNSARVSEKPPHKTRWWSWRGRKETAAKGTTPTLATATQGKSPSPWKVAGALWIGMTLGNRPFPSFPKPLSQSEAKWKANDMEMTVHSHANKSHFTSVHKKGFALNLVLKVRVSLQLGNCLYDTNVTGGWWSSN